MSTHNLRAGDRFGIRVGGSERGRLDNWLFCNVLAVKDGIIHGTVINGAWDFYFDPKNETARYADYYDKSLLTGWELAYTGPFPRGLRDYEEAIQFMACEVTRPYVVRRWRATWQRLRWQGGFFERLKVAIAAFKKAWATGVPYQSPEDDYDDVAF